MYSTVVAGFIDLVIEHIEAIISLTRSNMNGSAFALVRAVAEGLVRGVWFTACATQPQVLKFRNEDKIDPTKGWRNHRDDTGDHGVRPASGQAVLGSSKT